MAGQKKLPPVRIVADGDAPEGVSHLDNLKAMERVLKAHIHSENTLARDLSPLVRQARDISREISELEEKAEALEVEARSNDDASTEDTEFKLSAI